MSVTPKGLWYPGGSAAPNVPLDMATLALGVDKNIGVKNDGPGVVEYANFLVSQRASGGAAMFVDVAAGNAGSGAWVVVGTNGQLSFCPSSTFSAVTTLTVPANATGNPRIDSVFLQFNVSTGAFTLVYAAGTATAAATNDNRAGAPAQPASSLLLADIVVATGSVSIVDANIRDRRPFSSGIPPLATKVDMVAFTTPWGGPIGNATVDGTIHSTHQVAAAMYLPRRIVNATRVRWKYIQGGTAITGNWAIAIFDSSGRKVVDTGSIAFAGVAGSFNTVSTSIAATTFEPGMYYVFMGNTGATGTVNFYGLAMATSTVTQFYFAPNLGFSAATGGVIVPGTILGLTDMWGVVATTSRPGVPAIALSVG